MFSDSTDALKAAACGLGVTLARGVIAKPYLESGELVAVAGPQVPTRWQYFIVYPAHRPLKPAAQMFVDWVLVAR